MKYLAFFTLLALLLAPAAVQAQVVDARAQILKGQIEGFLENQKAMALKNGCKLDAKGEITVEKTSDYYAFTLPHLTYTDAKGIKSEIGMIAVNAVPDGDTNWKVSFSLPTQISSFNAGGAELFRTDIGNQTTSGVWNEKLGHFISLTSTIGDIRLNDLKTQGTATVGNLTFNSQVQENDPDAYTGSANATLSNVSFFDANTQFKGTVPQVAMTTNLADRAAKAPMTKEQVRTRPQGAYPDFFNVFSFLFGAPERVQVTVAGLDAVNAQLQQAMLGARTPDMRAKFLQTILGVSAVSGMGKPLPADQNSKYYDVVFGQGGNVMINGTDFGALVNSTTSTASGTPVLP